MKTVFLSAIFICFGFTYLPGQSDEVVKYYELKGQAYTQADSIVDVWMKTHYPVVLKKNKLKMTCAHCTNIFMDVIFGIREDGRLDDFKTVDSNKCGEKFSEKLIVDFLIFFENFIFPPSLRNRLIQFRFGTGLKC